MTITIERYIDNISNAQVQSLTCSFELLVYLLGDWLTYNELTTNSNLDFVDLAIGTKVYDNNNLIITIWINQNFIKDIEVKNYGNDLIYKLEQIEENIISTKTKGDF